MDFSRLTRTQKKRVNFLSKKRRKRQKEFESQVAIIKHFMLAFTAGMGFILLWSGISRWSSEFMNYNEAMAVGLGLLLVSGFMTKIFIKNFS
jgi:polyferredoxin